MGDTAMDHASMGHAPMEHNAADVPQVNETDKGASIYDVCTEGGRGYLQKPT